MKCASPVAATLVALAVGTGLSACRKDEDEARPRLPPPSAAPSAAVASASPTVLAPPSTPSLSSSVSTGNPALAHQLVSGFYAIEDNAWRWTGKNFTVNLAVPANAKASGAVLRFKFTLPEVVVAKHQTLAISAQAGAVAIPAQKFDKAGSHEFVADVPSAALDGASTQVAFSLDKSFRPEGGDIRELGVIANTIAIVPK